MEWLSDEVINGALKLIAEEDPFSVMLGEGLPNEQTKTVIINSFYFESLKRRGMGGVSKWMRAPEFKKVDILVFPLFQNSHWSMCSVYLKTRGAILCDSLRPFHKEAAAILLSHSDIDFVIYDLSTVQQKNGNDCGVFALYFIACFVFQKPQNRQIPIPDMFFSHVRHLASTKFSHEQDSSLD